MYMILEISSKKKVKMVSVFCFILGIKTKTLVFTMTTLSKHNIVSINC